jgi:hypothetical protein
VPKHRYDRPISLRIQVRSTWIFQHTSGVVNTVVIQLELEAFKKLWAPKAAAFRALSFRDRRG